MILDDRGLLRFFHEAEPEDYIRGNNIWIRNWFETIMPQIKNCQNIQKYVRYQEEDGQWLIDYAHINRFQKILDTICNYLEYSHDQGKCIKNIPLRQAMEEAPLWETQILAIQETQGEDIETVAELTDGYTIVRILSAKALKRESRLMGNCIYKDHSEKIVTSGIEYAYSLRNANNKPHVTLLSGYNNPNLIVELRGKQDRLSIGESYKTLLINFFTTQSVFQLRSPETLGLNPEAYRLFCLLGIPYGQGRG